MSACPLCGGREGETLEVIEYDRIWAALRTEWSARFSAEVVARHTPASQTEIRECTACGLQYFTPSVPGDAAFYEQLMATVDYYEEDRWEFEVVSGMLQAEADVADFGCGRGDFLRRIAPRVQRAAGVDSNPVAIGELARCGFEAHAIGFEQFAAGEGRAFDAVCAFQTVEHLASVGELVEPAGACLRPGGRLFVSVPNRERSWRAAFESFDYPPHHISRWRSAQFEALATRYGMALRGVWREPPSMWAVRDLERVRARERLSPVLGSWLADFAARARARALVGPRRHARAVESGKLEQRGLCGHAILAELVFQP